MTTTTNARVERLPLTALTINTDLQVRGRCDEQTIVTMTRQLVGDPPEQPPVEFDPIDVFRVDGVLHPVHGFHRYYAHQRAGLETIACSIREGTMKEAFEFALGANRKNGRQLTRKEQWNAIDTALRQFFDWSNKRIAAHVGSTHPTVERRRKLYLKTLPVAPDAVADSQVRFGSDGKKRKVKPTIGDDRGIGIDRTTQAVEANAGFELLESIRSIENSREWSLRSIHIDPDAFPDFMQEAEEVLARLLKIFAQRENASERARVVLATIDCLASFIFSEAEREVTDDGVQLVRSSSADIGLVIAKALARDRAEVLVLADVENVVGTQNDAMTTVPVKRGPGRPRKDPLPEAAAPVGRKGMKKAKAKRVLSEENRKKLAENLKKARAARAQNRGPAHRLRQEA